ARVPQFVNVGFDVSFQEIFTTWCAGGCLLPVEETTRRDPRAYARFVRERQATAAFLSPTLLTELAPLLRDAGDSALRELFVAGEQLPGGAATPALAAFGIRLPNH